MMHLVTGHAGMEHIMASDDGAFNAGVLGTGKYVLDLGNKFAYEIVSNNLVKILDGELVDQGRHARIRVNNYEEVTIENGLQGVKRYDLICMRYTKNADTNIESAELVVVKGTSSTSPSDPTCEEGNILEGELVDDFPLYRVRLDGLNIEGVDCLFEAMPSLEKVNAKADAAAEQAEANAEAIATIEKTITPVFIKQAGNAKAIPNNTPTNVNSITITKGLWYVTADVRWDAANTTGIRNLLVTPSETPTEGTADNESGMDRLIDTRNGSNKAFTTQVLRGIIRSSSEKKLYLHVTQNSGSELNTACNSISAYKLSDKMA